jgi:hypothetical protein
MTKPASWAPRSVDAVDLVRQCAERLELECQVLQHDFFPPALAVTPTRRLPRSPVLH